MKQCLQFVIFFCLLSLINASAQKYVIGAKGGLDFTKISAESFSSNYNVAFQLGGFAEIRLNKKWDFQTELIYNQIDDKLNQSQFEAVYENDFTFSENTETYRGTISVPLTLAYHINKLFTVLAGPQFSAMIYSNEDLFKNGNVAFKEIDLAGTCSAKIDLGVLRFYLKYNHGVTNINNYDNRDSWKTRQINFGMEVPIYKK